MNKRVSVAAFLLLCNCAQSGNDDSLASLNNDLRDCSRANGNNYFEVVMNYLNGPSREEWTLADCKLLAPIWTGNDDKGQMFTPLWRSPGGGIEDFIPAPPNGNCEGLKGTVRIDWDRSANTVKYQMKYTGLPVSPTIQRIDGGDPEIHDPMNPNHYVPPPQATWWYNQFHRAPKDFPTTPGFGTAYRLWTIFATFNTSQAPFYYDASTLKLRGSTAEFPGGPPANTITVPFGNAAIISTQLIYPNSRGFASRGFTVPYNRVTGEGGFGSHSFTTFVPHNLCRALPYQPTRGQLRPYTADFRPVSEGLPWDFILQQGLSFDLTIESGRPDVLPGQDDNNHDYIYSGIGFLQNLPAAQGGVPWGYHASLPASIQNVAPGIEQVPQCGDFLSNPQPSAPLFCQGQTSL